MSDWFTAGKNKVVVKDVQMKVFGEGIKEEFAKDYLEKSGDTEISGDYCMTHPEKGFVTFDITDDALVLVCVYGDGEYWWPIAEKIAKAAGVNKFVCATKKDPSGFIRKYGFKVVCTVLERELD